MVPPALPDCWKQLNVGGDNAQWVGSTTYPHTGTQAAFITYSYTGTVCDDWLFTRPLNFTAGDTMIVSYWFRQYLASTSWVEELSMWAGMGSTAASQIYCLDSAFTFTNFGTYTQHAKAFVVPTTGTWYIGWHNTSGDNEGGIDLDDIMINRSDYCLTGTLDVPAVSYPATVTLTATETGGEGALPQFQWFTGVGCVPANIIAGATTNQYTTTVAGSYSCQVTRGTCTPACDSAYADVTLPQPGEVCANALTLTPPVVGTPTTVTGTTVGFYAHTPNTCDVNVSTGPDLFYSLTIPGAPLHGCRRIAMALTGGDMQLAVYQGTANCASGTAFLCNDDWATFAPLPGWDVPAQHPLAAQESYIAADLEPGTYLIRVAYWDVASGPYTLTVYDNGACYEPCDSATALTVYLNPANPSQVWWHFNAPSQGTYKIFTTTVRNNDGNPNNGADPQWSLDTTLEILAAGAVECVDLDGGPAVNGYENFSVVHDCPILGRCCYGEITAPDCIDNTTEQCTALNGTWNRYLRCATTACPLPAYCAGGSSYVGCDEYISNVVVGTISNATGCAGGATNYADYTATLSTTMAIGTGYLATISNGNPYSSDQCGIWVDWNRDFDFDDTGETVVMTGSPGNGPYTATITPPAGSHLGATRMRVRVCYSSGLAACGLASYGDVEDYAINVTN